MHNRIQILEAFVNSSDATTELYDDVRTLIRTAKRDIVNDLRKAGISVGNIKSEDNTSDSCEAN